MTYKLKIPLQRLIPFYVNCFEMTSMTLENPCNLELY